MRGSAIGKLCPGIRDEGGRHESRGVVLILLLAVFIGASQADAGTCKTVVLADGNDPYYSLAEEIAHHEAIPLVGSLSEAFACDPTFVLWVVAPSGLSNRRMMTFGVDLREQNRVVAIGMISGSTVNLARDLWRRSAQAKGRHVVVVNAKYPSAGFPEGRLIQPQGNLGETHPLSKPRLLQALTEADYLTYTGHSWSDYWELEEKVTLVSEDIPRLPPVVISTAGCSSLRPWRNDSVALRFLDQGAAAYAGFAFSPWEGFLIGEFEDLPFRYTWPDFPIGTVMQAQLRGTMQSFAAFPYYWLLGDPRIALQADPPYRLVSERTEGDTLVLDYTDAPPGLIPVRIADGAKYRFVSIPGVTAATQDDRFYNSRLQMVDKGDDKYLIFVHRGGDFTLRLRTHPPRYWIALDLLLDSLDMVLCSSFTSRLKFVVIIGVVCLFAFSKRWTSVVRFGVLLPACAAAAGFALLHALYVLQRAGHYTLTSKPVVESTPWVGLATFVMVGCGAVLFFNVRSRLHKGLVLLLVTLPVWGEPLLALLFVRMANARIETPIYSARLVWLILPALVLEWSLFASAYWLLQKSISDRSR